MKLLISNFILFGETEIDNMHHVCTFSETDQKIVWFDVSVKEILCVQILDAVDHLVSKHYHSLQGEFSAAKTKEIL